VTGRVLGEDAPLLVAAGADVAALAEAERGVLAGIDLPGHGLWVDAHVHLGVDRDGHALAAADLVADMDAVGVATALCFPPDDPGPDGRFRRANDLVLAAADAEPGRIVPFCRLDPTCPWRDEMERAAGAGAAGLKLHPVAQRFRPEDPACVEVVAAATERGWPVLVHAGFGARPLAGPVAALLDAVPRARLILAHGGRGDARALRELALRHPTVLFDTSLASLTDLVALPPSRLSFGSDRPYGEHASALHLVAAAARIAAWSAAEAEGVMWGNLRAWLE
jgi:uncharacterized protein